MAEKTIIKETMASQTRTLADGTKKVYTYKIKYKVSAVGRSNNSRPEKFTPEQKKQIIEKRAAGITIKRICADMNSSYTAVKRCIDKNNAAKPAQPELKDPNELK